MYISEHTVGVGADSSRPYIIHSPTNKLKGLFSANISKHTVGVGTDSSRPTIIHNPTNTPQGSFIA